VLQETVGTQVSSFMYPLGSTSPLFQSDPNVAPLWYHGDGLGSVRALTDGSGAVKNTNSYSAFGGNEGATGKAANTHLFAGEQLDPTGLYYNRARYYNPNIGRFIGRDSFEGYSNNLVSQNRYAYAHNNPILNVDPSGNQVPCIPGVNCPKPDPFKGPKPRLPDPPAPPTPKTPDTKSPPWWLIVLALLAALCNSLDGGYAADDDDTKVIVYRFADRNDPSSLLPPLARANLSESEKERIYLRATQERGYAQGVARHHSLGKDRYWISPFVSVTLDDNAVANSPDNWARTIATGKPGFTLPNGDSAKKAPDIGVFLVPKEKLYDPNTGLAKVEKEMLFLGFDLIAYWKEWRVNNHV
jgi:RHS repeat-associated protein